MRAVFEFLPSVSEELPLFTGDVIEVISVVDEFWLLGNKDGVTGKVSREVVAVNRPFKVNLYVYNTLCTFFTTKILSMIVKLHRETFSIIVIVQRNHMGNCSSIWYLNVLGERFV